MNKAKANFCNDTYCLTCYDLCEYPFFIIENHVWVFGNIEPDGAEVGRTFVENSEREEFLKGYRPDWRNDTQW